MSPDRRKEGQRNAHKRCGTAFNILNRLRMALLIDIARRGVIENSCTTHVKSLLNIPAIRGMDTVNV
ncbi:Uncharacterised protein [Salmonella bongori]|nr:Uncharacterised protein [Salmonella bongori]